MRILIVKLSSMGDILHTLPALSDLGVHFPDSSVDWVVEEAFKEIPHWHKQVNRIIPIALRKWRKNIITTLSGGELKNFYHNLRIHEYDYVIDAQSSIKSAVVTRLSRGCRYGLDKASSREAFVQGAYQHTFFVEKKLHAITRIRQLLAGIFGYSFEENEINYGLDLSRFSRAISISDKPYIVCQPNTSRSDKKWANAEWINFFEKTEKAQISVYMPWGTQEEKSYITSLIKNNFSFTHCLPAMSLTDIASLLAHASAFVGVDTGISHLAAAVNTPGVIIYNNTDPHLVGTKNNFHLHLNGKEAKTGELLWNTIDKLVKLTHLPSKLPFQP